MKISNVSLRLTFLANDLGEGKTQVQSIDSSFIVNNSITLKKQLLNGLKSSSNQLSLQLDRACPSIESIIKTEGDIKAVLADGDVPIFTGYLSTSFSWSVTSSGVQALSLTIEDVGTRLLTKNFIKSGYHLFNCTASKAISAICESAGVTVSDECEEIEDNILGVVDSSKSCKDILTQMLYELGYVYYFDNKGELRVFKIDCASTEGIPVFDKKSLYIVSNKAVSLSKKLRSYKSARVEYKELETVNDYLIYRNTTNADEIHVCKIPLGAGQYFDGTEIFDKQEDEDATESFRENALIEACNATSEMEHVGSNKIVCITDVRQDFVADDRTVESSITEGGGPYIKILVHNPDKKAHNVTRLDAYATVTYEKSSSIVRTNTSALTSEESDATLKESLEYVHEQELAQKHANLLGQYNRFCNAQYTFYSKVSIQLGSIIKLHDDVFSGLEVNVMVIASQESDSSSVVQYSAIGISVFSLLDDVWAQKQEGGKSIPTLTGFIATLSRDVIECFSNRTPRDKTPVRFKVQIDNPATVPRLTVAGKVVEMQRDEDGSWIYDIDANLDGYDTCKLTLVVGNRTSEYIISKLVKNDSIPPDIVVPEGWKEVLQFAYGSADGILLTGYVEDKDAIVADSECELADVGWTDAVDGECPLRPVNDYFIWQRQGVYDPESKEFPSDWTLSLYDTPYYRFDFTLSQSTYSFDTRADESDVNEIHIKPNIVAFEASALVVSATLKDGIDENGSPKVQTKQLPFDKINQEYLLTVPIKTAPIDSIVINAKLGVLSWQAILLPEDITEYGHYYGIVEIGTKTEDDKEVDDLDSIKDNPVFANPLPTYRDGRPKDYFTSKLTGITYEYQANGKWEACDDASRLIEGLKGLIDENIDLNQISDANTVAFFRQIVAQKIYAEQIKVTEGFFDRIEVSGDSRLLGQLENDAITTFPASTQDIKAKADFVQLSILSLEPLEVMRVGTPQKKYYAWGLKKADLGKAFERGGIFGDKDYARTRFEGTVRLDGETYTATNTDPFIVSWHPDASQPTLSIEGGGIPKKTAYTWGAEDNYSNYIWDNAYIIFRPSTDEIPETGKLESIDIRAWNTSGGFYTQKILPRASGGQVGEEQERFLKGYFEELFATTFHGSVEGSIKGDVTGDTKGLHTGDVKGNITGNVNGNVTGNLTGDVTGNVNAEGTSNKVWGAVFN